MANSLSRDLGHGFFMRDGNDGSSIDELNELDAYFYCFGMFFALINQAI